MTMKQGVYTFAIGFMIHLQSAAETTLETVWLKDATEKRTLSNIDLPNELAFHLTRRSETLKLNLRRNHDINPNPNVYFARKLQNGTFVLVKSRNIAKQNLAYYQDIKNGAFMTVRCVKKSNEQCNRIIGGNVRIGNRDYELQPAEIDVAARNLYDEPGALGRKYVLQDQTHNQREYSVKNKDATNEMEKTIQQKRMTLSRRFQAQHKQKHLSPAIASLSGTNESTLHKSGKRDTDKSRQLGKIYYVKVAVLIDPGLWDFYHSTVRSFNLLKRNRLTKEKIERWYSHIMNGVNMVYKGIEDTSIRIIVILSEFIIFKKKHEFQLHESRVVNFFGIYLVDGPSYLNDIITWDKETDVKEKKLFSHGMLFTRYKMFENELSEKELSGLSFVGEVCNVGKRMSAVERRGYVWMVHVAAHELGHNLGACHDGEEDAKNCTSEDSFIMSKVIVENNPYEPHNQNPWHFSTCSINLFKKTLPTKTCLNDYISPHNDYYKYVTKEPGEVFTVNEQCELIAGRRSVLCETARHNLCLLMRCTVPRTDLCIPEYHGAARGTECGKDMWCIDGLCVPKQQNRLLRDYPSRV